VVIYQKEENDKSKNRRSPCYFCGNVAKHIQAIHKVEPEVIKAVKKRDRGDPAHLQRIVFLGIFNHNISVVKHKEGMFFVARSSTKTHCEENYLPCCYCMQFIIKRELYRHCKRCKLKEDSDKSNFAVDGRLVLDGALLAESTLPKSLNSKVLRYMKNDHLTRVLGKMPVS
jgi:hypothetical protein